MNAFSKLRWKFPAALAGLIALGTSLSPIAHAKAAPDRDRQPTQAAAKAGGCDLGSAETNLDGNNVNALLFNNGALFWKGGDHVYEVPKGSARHSIFASGIWLAGEVDGAARFAGTDYGPYEYYPGPLDANGNVTQEVCSQFDRFWKVNRQDIFNYNQSGDAAPDLATWPIAFGAPFFVDLNGDGRRTISLDDDEGNGDEVFNEPSIELALGDAGYGTRQLNLAAGERPDIIGDQGIWWVMNDNGGPHNWSELPALQVEVQAHAFSFATADALNNTTFYQYQIFYRGTQTLTNAYVGLWSDPDLGDAGDDYVGSNPESGIGFVYNGDSFDGTGAGYGSVPPALGYDFFQGPLVDNDDIDNNGNGEVDEEGERIAMEKFVYYNNDSSVQGNPVNGVEGYQYLRGLWRDGSPITFGGVGYQTGEETDFMFPANPPAFWSEYNIDGLGTSNIPADRRFVMSAGPFSIEPGDFQEIVFGIVWSQAQGTQSPQPQVASVRQMFFDDITAQAAFNADFNIPPPPPSVVVTATPLDQTVVLEWNSETGDILDLFQYEVESPFAEDGATDDTYNFEGFQVFQYANLQDQVGTLIATFDFQNNVTAVTDISLDTNTGEIITEVVALGEDNGGTERTPTSLVVFNDAFTSQPLRNNTTYYFGVQPYAYNAFSSPQKIYAAPVTRVDVRPSLVDSRQDGTVINATAGESLPVIEGSSNAGGGTVTARVTNPAAVTGDTYQVRFFTQTDGDGAEVGLNYDIVNTTQNEVIFSGAGYYARTGSVAPQTADIARADGLAFDVQGPPPAILGVAEFNAAGDVIDTNLLGSLNSASTRPPTYIVGAQGASASDATAILERLNFNNYLLANVPKEYEVRFVAPAEGQVILNRGASGADPSTTFMRCWEEATVDPATAMPTGIQEIQGPVVGGFPRLPFQLWEINPDGSEQQVHALILNDETPNDLCYSFSAARGNDGGLPFTLTSYERIYGTRVPYNEARLSSDLPGVMADVSALNSTNQAFGRLLVMPYTGPAVLPQAGTGIRIQTSKPHQPGDVFTVNTEDFRAVTGDPTTSADALDLIAITPNPYRGVAEYETQSDQNIARFVNLPSQATIRIFTLNGTLVRTLEKTNPSMTTIDWNLRTEAQLPIASGIYLIHVEARDSNGVVLGERVLKFGVVQRRVQLDVL